MARIPSTMVPLGTPAPEFSLLNPVDGATVTLGDFADRDVLLVMFICNHCPFVVHIRHELAAMGFDYGDRSLGIVAISSNDVENYPDDSPQKMAEEARTMGYTFPYLYDETQEVARAFGAVCTPDFFVYDRDRKLAYRGQLDGSRPGNDVVVNGVDLRAAVDALLAGDAPAVEQTPSVGCSIKWKSA